MAIGGFPDNTVEQFDSIDRINDSPYPSLIAELSGDHDSILAPQPGNP